MSQLTRQLTRRRAIQGASLATVGVALPYAARAQKTLKIGILKTCPAPTPRRPDRAT